MSACTANANTVCQRCSTCAAGRYISTTCQGSTNTGCSACSTCAAGQYIAQPCAGTTNTVCRNCTTSCSGSPDQYLTTCSSTSTTDAACQTCSRCPSGQFVASNCTANSDTVCRSCRTCDAGLFVKEPCSQYADTQCHYGRPENGQDVNVLLGNADVLQLQLNTEVGTSNANTFFSMSNGSITDIQGNFANVLPSTAGLAVASFTQDTNPPVLLDFSVDVNQNLLTLTFSKSMNVSSLNAAGISFQTANSSAAVSYTLTASSSVLVSGSNNSHLVSLILSASDMSELKSRSPLMRAASSTFLTATSATIVSMNRLQLVSILSSNALIANNNTFVSDTTPPRLSNYTLNLSTGVLSLRFDETIGNASQLGSAITLQDAAPGALATYTLTGGAQTLVNITDLDTVQVQISPLDFNTIRANPNFATTVTNTYLRIAAGGVRDIAGNSIANMADAAAQRAIQVYADSVRPQLVSFSLNMNDNLLTLVFSETVNSTSFNARGLTFQPVANAASTAAKFLHVLLPSSTASGVANPSWTTLNIALSSFDLNGLKRVAGLARAASSTFLSLLSITVSDMSGNAVVAIPSDTGLPVTVSGFQRDSVGPALSGFDLNMNTGLLTIRFSEPVDPSSLQVGRLRLQHASTAPASSSEFYALVASSSRADSSALALSVGVRIGKNDLNNIKLRPGIATSQNNTYLFIDAGAIQDANGNAISAQPVVQATTVVADNQPPKLENFELNIENGYLVLTLDEIVDVTSIHRADVTLINSATGDSVNQLTLN